MGQHIEAEIVTERPDPIIEKLTALGYALEVIDWPGEDVVTIVAVALTELDQWDYFDHVKDIAEAIDPTAILMTAAVRKGTEPVTPGVTSRRVGTYPQLKKKAR